MSLSFSWNTRNCLNEKKQSRECCFIINIIKTKSIEQNKIILISLYIINEKSFKSVYERILLSEENFVTIRVLQGWLFPKKNRDEAKKEITTLGKLFQKTFFHQEKVYLIDSKKVSPKFSKEYRREFDRRKALLCIIYE